MRLDQNGMWIDPGPIDPEYLRSYGACETPTPDAPENAPLPLPKLEEIPAPAGDPIPSEPLPPEALPPEALPPEPSLPEILPPEPAEAILPPSPADKP
jgi:hypothetical protein